MAVVKGSIHTGIGYVTVEADTYMDFYHTIEAIKKEYGLAKNSGPVLTFNGTTGGIQTIG
jgi:hypothetical protein